MTEGTGRRKLSQAAETDSGEKDFTGLEAGSDDENPVEVRPIGEVIKRLNKGKGERRYYEAFELDGVRYDLEDAVLVTPEQRGQKPYVAIIKEIKQSKDGAVAVTGQWFYRPEEAEKKGGGSWSAFDSRELFYSFHRDEVPAESVMHKCIVHFIPPQKQPPVRTKHPGFIVRQVYDTVEKKLWKLTDKDYEDSKQREIDLLVQKTRESLGDLHTIDAEEVLLMIDQEEAEKIRRHNTRRKAMPHLSITKEDSGGEVAGKGSASEAVGKFDAPPSTKIDTPSSCKTPCGGFPSDILDLLRANNALTGQSSRDRWLEKITRTLKSLFDTEEPKKSSKTPGTDSNVHQEDNTPMETDEAKGDELTNGEGEQKLRKDMLDGVIVWPESAISAVNALEKVAFGFHGSDVHKYNLKMRQLDFNLKKSPVLARRVLNKDLEPSTVLHMTPVELKDGLTAAEKKAREPVELETLQMTDARCGICGEREVGVKDIIQVGYGDRYQLECLKCGNSWYASRDSVSSLTTSDTVGASPTVGLAPWATSKFEEVEKELISPREPEKFPGVQEALPSGDVKVKEGEETRTTPLSHYADVENSLTEHINLPGHALSAQDRGKVDDRAETKAGPAEEGGAVEETLDTPDKKGSELSKLNEGKEDEQAQINRGVKGLPPNPAPAIQDEGS